MKEKIKKKLSKWLVVRIIIFVVSLVFLWLVFKVFEPLLIKLFRSCVLA